MNNLEIEQLDELVAEKFWNEDTDTSVFTKPSILKNISHTVHWWGCFSNRNLIAAWPICIDSSENVFLPEFSYYIGPVLSNKISTQPEHRKSSLMVKIYSSFVSRFENLYKNIEFCCDTKLIDIRFFLWENHQIDHALRYQIDPRYTACIDNLRNKSEYDIQYNFRSVRRQSIKYASQKNFRVVTNNHTNHTNEVVFLYQKTLERQGIFCEKNTLTQIANLTLKTPKENLLCVHIYPESSDDLIFFGLILHDNNSANLILNCTHSHYRNTGVSSLGIYSSIIESKKVGCNIFDFNGANSPSRADDKHSYGAKPRLFFHVKKSIK